MFKLLIRKILPEVLRYTEIVYPYNVQYLLYIQIISDTCIFILFGNTVILGW